MLSELARPHGLASLRLRLFVAFALVALFCTLTYALAVVFVTGRQASVETIDRLRSGATSVQAVLELEKDRDLSDAAELAATLAQGPGFDSTRAQQLIAAARLRVKDDYIAVVDPTGQVLVEDATGSGTTDATEETIRPAQGGRAIAQLVVRNGQARVEGIAPVQFGQSGDRIVAYVVAGDLLDGRFLERVGKVTGFESALFSDATLLASVVDAPRPALEASLRSTLATENRAERLDAGESLPASLDAAGRTYSALLVPLTGPAERTVAGIVLAAPARVLSARQVELLVPLLVILPLLFAVTLALSYFISRAIAGQSGWSAAPPTRTIIMAKGPSPLPTSDSSTTGAVLELPDGLVVDPMRHEVRRGERRYSLTATEFRLLATLASEPGRVFTRQELLDRVWGSDYAAETGVIDTHVSNLRRKLEQAPAGRPLIVTIRGVGFKLRTGD